MSTQAEDAAARAEIVRGARDSIPLGVALAAVGVAFGYAAHEAGLSWWLAGLMSLTTYGGPSQFLAVSLIGIGAAVPAIVATVFVA
ncbi:MAG: AzlC protein, partial [Thermoleophilaceae bacterium]|nr:AzlC protein [Thermoleophilaceae bacterium]